MHILIPMSGVGQRFLDAGYTNPKPLIQVDGKPIIERVVSMFPGEEKVTFICNTEHLATTSIAEELHRIAPGCTIVPSEKKKVGPVYHLMQAADLIDDDEPCMVTYCDYHMLFDRTAFKQRMLTGGYDGAMQAYIGFHPHLLHKENLYASMRVDEHNNLLEIREKHSFTPNTMDCYQGTGSFYFKSGRLLKKYCQQLMDSGNTLNGEYYISVVFDLMQKDGCHIYVDDVEKFCQWGAPKDLQEYEMRVARVHANDMPTDPIEQKIYAYWKEYLAKRG